ncbi:cyclic AMP-dependent transcription factor ATF-3-like [Limulus polyphemus]|uniref:Cyclic AMP-dependent transcription factor ATF-3-like n=1 Tax=Limulus polyphemus TaxID=6850 RepID=A0ABM1C4B9_LIMPO|nr:cyclic AMP-dependent transcription factor ATF-3-like [Limulus polyphemus]
MSGNLAISSTNATMFGYDNMSPTTPDYPKFDTWGFLETTHPLVDSQKNRIRPQTPDVLSALIEMPNPPEAPTSYVLNSPPQSLLSPSSPSTSSCSIPSPTVSRPPSVQATMSLLVKEGLKMTIQTKRKIQGKDQIVLEHREPSQDQLTLEDKMRRMKRRERNKVAAAKCRKIKKERTYKLAIESEHLEADNFALRTEIQSLKLERQKLLALLTNHLPRCCLPLQQNSCAQSHTTHPWPIV